MAKYFFLMKNSNLKEEPLISKCETNTPPSEKAQCILREDEPLHGCIQME